MRNQNSDARALGFYVLTVRRRKRHMDEVYLTLLQAGKKGALIKENKYTGTGSWLCGREGLEEVVDSPQWEGRRRPYAPLSL